MAVNSKTKIVDAYIDYVLTHNEKPNSVYVFTKNIKMKEGDFYNHFSSFDAIDSDIWLELLEQTITDIQNQEVYQNYSTREKALAFYYTFTENLKNKRSFAVYSIKQAGKSFHTPAIFKKMKASFEQYADALIAEGLDSQELTERKFISDKYKDALWVQLAFIVNFWVTDDSAGFEKTDEAIEKGINVTFDLMSRSPIDNLIEYGKFLAKNGKITYEGAK